MDNLTKGLIIAGATIVGAAVGYFSWRKFDAHRANKRAAR